ncbi:hypothetical protein QLQ12_35960 [Actinoplanes sp. NEAU-A12]|uniref:Uncharacterized protein n=1 Tax=Actinoplanes sandaracinus TaxID=3045177 RepID=A0ABT6WWK9_9ACTN|nr:hypothetical protein [Actinoplanes sandaracinus]MDI6104000.1 hypothetical protein [Actinoplanes sandaracinus]
MGAEVRVRGFGLFNDSRYASSSTWESALTLATVVATMAADWWVVARF